MSDLRKKFKDWVNQVKVEHAEGRYGPPSDEMLVALLEAVVRALVEDATAFSEMELREIQALAAKAAAEKGPTGTSSPTTSDPARPEFDSAKMEETWAVLEGLAGTPAREIPGRPGHYTDPEPAPVATEVQLVVKKTGEDKWYGRPPEPEFRVTFSNGTVLLGQLQHLSGCRLPKGS